MRKTMSVEIGGVVIERRGVDYVIESMDSIKITDSKAVTVHTKLLGWKHDAVIVEVIQSAGLQLVLPEYKVYMHADASVGGDIEIKEPFKSTFLLAMKQLEECRKERDALRELNAEQAKTIHDMRIDLDDANAHNKQLQRQNADAREMIIRAKRIISMCSLPTMARIEIDSALEHLKGYGITPQVENTLSPDTMPKAKPMPVAPDENNLPW